MKEGHAVWEPVHVVNVELNRATFYALSQCRWTATVCAWDYKQDIKPVHKDSVMTFFNYPNEPALTESFVELRLRANQVTARERFLR